MSEWRMFYKYGVHIAVHDATRRMITADTVERLKEIVEKIVRLDAEEE